jgi:hypothetical protein
VRRAADAMAGGHPSLRREVLTLVGSVLLLHGGFIALYLVAHLASASPDVRSAFAVAWTAATLAVVLRGLGRVRALRVRRRRSRTR